MASEDRGLELEDGEINDLEDGEIDEDIPPARESNNNDLSLLVEHRHDQYSIREQYPSDNSFETKNRDFGFQDSNFPPDWWETRGGSLGSFRGRFPRHRGRGRGKVFRVNGREKTYPAKRGNSRRPFLRRPNLPYPFPTERSRSLYPDERLPLYAESERARIVSPFETRPRPQLEERRQVYLETDRPRLPRPSTSERHVQRLPLMELEEKSRQFLSESSPSAPDVGEEQPRRVPSPFDEEVDDYRILLQRHRLIQQQLAALENQENSSLGDDTIIDETFIDIPVDDSKPDLLLENEKSQENFDSSRQDGFYLPDDINLQHMGSGNEIDDLEKANEILDNELTAEPAQPKPFLPFKIKPLYSNVPSIKELSQKDLEQRKVKGGNSTAMESGRADDLETMSRTRKSEPMSKIRKNRRKRKRKVSQASVQNNVNSQKARAGGCNQGPHVDPHNELEARLLSLAGSSVPVESNREEINKKQERRERLRQWQEKMNNDRFSDQKNQQGNKGRGKKKMTKPAKGSRRSSSLKVAENEMGGDRDSLRKGVDPALFENDDYFEIPMDVESDSTDGPALPLIDEPAEDFPPPPPPLPSGESAASVYMDPGQPALMMYPPGYFQNYADWFAGSAPLMTAGHEDQLFQYQEFLGKESHPLEGETTKELPQVDSRDVSSQENSDEDDEVALREQLLKSLAVKRKAKIDAGKGEDSAKNESGPRSQSTRVSKIRTNTLQPVKQQQDSRQVAFAAPPKHDPVVIKLGEDSDTDESDASDTESVKKAAPNKKKSVGRGLFGGLEMMIKEARKSAEASKVKATEKSQAGEGIQKGKTDQQPPEPTTPDAMAHMPEQMKTEYKRLKEQLALRESKTRQPLTTVNQEKEAMLSPATPENEERNEINEDDSHLKELHSFVTGCEENLIKHKKFIQKDKVTLNKLLVELLHKKRSHEAQEENVRKLQKELEAAQKVSLANKILMNKLRSRTKLVRDRLGKRQLAASTFEEELLRAKSIISAVKRKMPMAGEAGSGQNSPQLEPLGNVGNENQKFTISPAAAWEIKNSLDAKFEKLSTFTKQDTTEKRKLEVSEPSSEVTLAKKAKQILVTPQGSPAHSATTTPRKSAVAERIAQEKARLKKLEHELSEKLKQFGREREGDRGSALNASEKILQSSKDSSDVKTIGKEEKKHEFGTSRDNTSHVSQEQGFDSREASGQFLPGGKEITPLTDGKTPITFELEMTTQQLEHVRKLQTEKEKIGPQFPACTLDVPLTADQHSTLCVCLPFGYELKSIVRDQDNLTEREDQSTELAAGELRRINDYEATPIPFGKYHSDLLHFKSYRLSPYFRLQGGFSLTSLTFSNKVDPMWPLCNFDLQGKCNDEDCKFQHFVKCKMLQEEILQDLAAYNPNLTVDFKDVEEMQESVESFTKAFMKQYQDKMSWDELCILLVNDVRKSRKENGPFNISLQPRTWKLQKPDKKEIEYENNVEIADKGKGINFSNKDKVHGVVSKNSKSAVRHQLRVSGEESQEIRYFLEEYNNIESLEASLENSPGDVALWLKLARLKLHQNNSTAEGEKEDTYNNNVMQALSTLSRGLEENNQSEELWLEYLELYSSQSSREELNEICVQAVEFSPTYNVWWKYLEYSRTYTDKRNVCVRLIAFLSMNPIEPVELHSHFVLETLLYLVQLELYSGHYASAVLVFKSALTKRMHGCSDVPELSSFLLASDYCCAWLGYIHLVEFHRLPSPWFDPSHGEPSKMVTKEDFVFPWKLSQQSRAPGKKLLVLFQDALKACGEVVKPPFDKFTICLPLYKNLLALERAYGRVDSARGICRHLLKDHPSTVVLWQCLAALEDSPEKGGNAEQVYMEALDKCEAIAELSYSAARFYLQQNKVQKAISVLIKSVLTKFAAKIDSQGCEIQSVAGVSLEDQAGDPVALYRRLLSLPLPYDYKCPPLLPNVEPQSLGKEKVFLWLSYCLLLEIAPPTNTSWDDLTPESAFETAVHSPLPRHDVQVLWTEYLFYQRSKALQERHFMDELVDRCLMSVSTSNSLPHSSSVVWRDYRFHNQIISLSLSCHPQSSWSSVFQRYLRIFPGNVMLAIRAISIELQRNCVKEARKMYHQATEVLPFAATLWKDFLMFELARSGDASAVQEILAKSREIGVKLEEFLNTLLGLLERINEA